MSLAASPTSADEALWPALPSATVVVLNHNGRHYLDTCFRSLRELMYPADRLEIMLADNFSTDGSVEFTRQNFPEVKVVAHPANYGFSRGNNLAAAQAKGEVVAFLNNDMRVDRRWLIELARPLVDDPEVVCSGSKILTWDGKQIDFAGSAMNFYGFGYQLGWGDDSVTSASADDGFRNILFPCGGAMLVRRQPFLESGGFDEDFFAYYEDVDLGWRLWVLGYKIVFAPRSITYHFHHGYWGKVADEKKRVLYERNATLAMIKNYEDDHLHRFLPAALMLLSRRAYLFARIDDTFFRAGPRPQPVAPPPAPAATLDALTQSAPPALSTTPMARLAGALRFYLSGIGRLLARGDYGGLFQHGRAEVARLGQLLSLWVRARVAAWAAGPDMLVPRQAVSYLVAADDVIWLYERMLAKRRQIQSRRKRADRDIFPLFRLPLEVSLFHGDYEATQRYLTRVMEIDRVFDTA